MACKFTAMNDDQEDPSILYHMNTLIMKHFSHEFLLGVINRLSC